MYSNSNEPAISIENVSHSFSTAGTNQVLAIDDVSISVRDREFIALVGPSGCGKTTLMNIVAGLVPLQEGSIRVRGTEVGKPRRDIGYISARDSLLPWRTAKRNVEYGLEVRGMDKHERSAKSREMLELVGLADFGHAYRSQLSQGMRQRVAIARTLATDPSILFLDEPFSALDQQTKLILEAKFMEIWDRSHKTVIMVTHDIEEAVAMADRVIMLSSRPGRIVLDLQIDLPRPRDVAQIRFDPRFTEITHSIWDMLKVELDKLPISQKG
jgi:NitT/TauT family transport system ATP-binding protein